MFRLGAHGVLWVMVSLALLYLGDMAVWRARGGPVETISIDLLKVATLKGNKEEYFPDGNEEVDCSRSLFPQAGGGACWWVKGHRTVYER